jgi:hypothetical protein
VGGAVRSGHERDRLAVEPKAVAEVDVVEVAVGEILDLVPFQVVDREAAELVRADDRAARGVVGMNPDRRIVGIAARRDRIRLAAGRATSPAAITNLGLIFVFAARRRLREARTVVFVR